MINTIKNEYPDWTGRVYNLVLVWSITQYCNFSCHGCAAKAFHTKKKYVPEITDIVALNKTLNSLNQTIKIVFTGGEPLLKKNIIDVFEAVTSKHYMSLITNLTNSNVKELANRINPERVVLLKASSHLFQLEKYGLLNTYLENYKLLQEKGFPIFNEEIAYPVLAGKKVEKFKKIFQAHGIELKFQAYRGKWKGKKYPDSYTEEQYKFFNFTEIGSSKTEMHYRKGKLCNAGYNIFAVNPYGDVVRCYEIPDSYGNLYTGFKFDNTLIDCPLDYCDCPFSEFESHLYEKALDETR